MKKLFKFLLFVGAVAGAAWALRDQLMPPPQAPSSAPPAFRTGDASSEPHEPADAEDLTAINGIGPVRIEQLSEAGITSFAELAEADAVDIAARLGVSVSQTEDWIGQARERT